MQGDQVNQLCQALAATLQADNNIRTQAEVFIKEQQKQPGYLSGLLQITMDPNFNNQIDWSKIQQANVCVIAAVNLGTVVAYNWKFKDQQAVNDYVVEASQTANDYVIFHPEDKQMLKDKIVNALFEAQNMVIQKQLVRAIMEIAKFDFPEQWPNLLTNDIIPALKQENGKAIQTGLQALFALVKKYEYSSSRDGQSDRDPLFHIMDQTFPLIGDLINSIFNQQVDETSLRLLHLIVKIFHTCNHLEMFPYLMNVDNLKPWMEFFKSILDNDVPEELAQPTDEAEKIAKNDSSIHWKIKGIAAKTVYKILVKYGRQGENKEEKKFGKAFIEVFGMTMLEANLTTLFKRETQFIGSKTINYIIKYITVCTQIKKTMTALQPHVDRILYTVVIPTMKITQRDEELLLTDPIEFIRKQEDFTETLFMPRNTIIDLLSYLCSFKPSKGKGVLPLYLTPFLNYVGSNLSEYASQPDNSQWKIKEALLAAVGALSEHIQRHDLLASSIEPTLMEHVFKDLASDVPFLRRRACYLYGDFATLDFQNADHLKSAIEGIYQNLFYEHLPVSYAAALSLTRLLDNKKVSEIVRPQIEHILRRFLELMNDIDSEELVGSLSQIMTIFQDDIAPYAIMLSEKLVQQYKKLIQVDDTQDDGEAALAAIECVSALRRILEACKSDVHLLAKLQEIVFPLLLHGLTPDGADMMEDGLDCIAVLLYYTQANNLKPQMWILFPQLIYIVAGKDTDQDGGYGYEHLSQVAVCLQNFIVKDPKTLMTIGENQTESYCEMVTRFLTRVLYINSNSSEKTDGIVAMKVVIALLENMDGQLDQYFERILEILLAELFNATTKKTGKNYISMILQAISASFYYNAQGAFQIIEKNNQTINVFNSWNTYLLGFKHDFELRRTIFGFISILRLPFDQIPQIVQQGITEIGKQLVQICLKMQARREKVLKENKEHLAKGGMDTDSDDDDEEEEEVEDFDDDEDSEGNMDAANMSSNNNKRKPKKGQFGFDDSDGDDDDSDYEYTGGDLALFDSRLDNEDELKIAKESLDAINAQNADYLGHLFSKVDQQDNQSFQTIMNNIHEFSQVEKQVSQELDQLMKTKKSK